MSTVGYVSVVFTLSLIVAGILALLINAARTRPSFRHSIGQFVASQDADNLALLLSSLSG